MDFTELASFIRKKMRMSHVYQPVMLMTLLRRGGACSETEIAKSILAHGQSQIEYYENITRNMVGRVLRNHGMVVRGGKTYRLTDFDQLSEKQIEKLIKMGQDKLDSYLKKRGETIWEHRKMSAGYISGTLKYEVLKRAGFHCELCGISADEKALEVDHIIPRNHGGSDDLSNLQALCYSCNAMKRDEMTLTSGRPENCTAIERRNAHSASLNRKGCSARMSWPMPCMMPIQLLPSMP